MRGMKSPLNWMAAILILVAAMIVVPVFTTFL